MSARDEYGPGDWIEMCDEIDQLRSDLASMTEVAAAAMALAMVRPG